MGLKNDVELQLINFQKAYNSLDTSAEDYDAQLAKLQKDYNLNLDANQIANSKGIDPLSLDDADSVRKRMFLNAKRDRKKSRRDYWTYSKEERSEIAPNLLQTGMDVLPGLVAGILDNDYSNALASFSANAVNPIVDVIGNTQKMLSSMSLNKQAIPGQGTKSGESQFAKQGIKIEYMNLFK